jgi:hypothetical protein
MLVLNNIKRLIILIYINKFLVFTEPFFVSLLHLEVSNLAICMKVCHVKRCGMYVIQV